MHRFTPNTQYDSSPVSRQRYPPLRVGGVHLSDAGMFIGFPYIDNHSWFPSDWPVGDVPTVPQESGTDTFVGEQYSGRSFSDEHGNPSNFYTAFDACHRCMTSQYDISCSRPNDFWESVPINMPYRPKICSPTEGIPHSSTNNGQGRVDDNTDVTVQDRTVQSFLPWNSECDGSIVRDEPVENSEKILGHLGSDFRGEHIKVGVEKKKTSRVDLREERMHPMGLTMCLRKIARCLLSNTKWVVSSSTTKAEAHGLIQRLVGRRFKDFTRSLLNPPNPHDGNPHWKEQFCDDVLTRIMSVHLGTEIDGSELEVYLARSNGKYFLTSHFRRLLGDGPWPPYMPRDATMIDFKCHRNSRVHN